MWTFATLSDWLAAPLGGAVHHSLSPWVAWHARGMVLAWGLLLPLGALTARYFKVTATQRWPQELDNRLWWQIHRHAQWAGIGLMTVALGLVLLGGSGVMVTPSARGHQIGGWAVVVLGWAQIASGLARGSKGGPTDSTLRGDHYDMTRWRQGFERWHKALGWLAVLGSIATVGLGLLAADAPRWMPVVLAGWWLLLAAGAWRLQRQGRCIDTYQAIWGPDPCHPGNRLPPIGWGVHRPTGPSPSAAPAPASTLRTDHGRP